MTAFDPINTKRMRDKISIQRAELMHPEVRQELKDLIVKSEEGLPANVAVRLVQTLRTIDEQNNLYAQGRTKPGKIVTNAKGGSSYHNYGLAFDFCLVIDKDGNGTYDIASWDIKKDNDKDGVADWLEVVKIFEAAGWEWGGKWSSIKDYPHLQKTFGYNWRTLLRHYNEGRFIEGTKYVKI